MTGTTLRRGWTGRNFRGRSHEIFSRKSVTRRPADISPGFRPPGQFPGGLFCAHWRYAVLLRTVLFKQLDDFRTFPATRQIQGRRPIISLCTKIGLVFQ